jgi:hypothetical protein
MFYGKYFLKRKFLSLNLNVFNVSDFLSQHIDKRAAFSYSLIMIATFAAKYKVIFRHKIESTIKKIM